MPDPVVGHPRASVAGAGRPRPRRARRRGSADVDVRAVLGQPVPGCAVRPAAGSAARARAGSDARHDAADQRDEQQQVDRGEPRRRRRRRTSRAGRGTGRRRVLAPGTRPRLRCSSPRCGKTRAGDRREREQEQQDQRGAHRRQLPPRPAQPAADRQRGRAAAAPAGWTAWSCPAARSPRCRRSLDHRPEAADPALHMDEHRLPRRRSRAARPTTTSMRAADAHHRAVVALDERRARLRCAATPSPTSTNGSPSPRQ